MEDCKSSTQPTNFGTANTLLVLISSTSDGRHPGSRSRARSQKLFDMPVESQKTLLPDPGAMDMT